MLQFENNGIQSKEISLYLFNIVFSLFKQPLFAFSFIDSYYLNTAREEKNLNMELITVNTRMMSYKDSNNHSFSPATKHVLNFKFYPFDLYRFINIHTLKNNSTFIYGKLLNYSS